MPKFLEKKLKKEYGENSKVPYAIMNKLGYMRGNKETAKGRVAQKKHNKKVARYHTQWFSPQPQNKQVSYL